jgi:hypothetical protein
MASGELLSATDGQPVEVLIKPVQKKMGLLRNPLSESKALEDTCHSQDRLPLFT